jgi:hypothetical protein
MKQPTTAHPLKYSRFLDLFINVALPVLSGYMIYLSLNGFTELKFIKDHLPDGLWAYGFLSCILIIWDRIVPSFWLLVIIITSYSFELMQYFKIINGTADWWDIFFYTVFFAIALFINNCINLKYEIK